MKGFFGIFQSSLNELKDVRTLTIAGMLMAVAIALRSVAIEITQDIRISFSFIAIIIIAILFGPVVAGMANLSSDFLGYVLTNHTTREYSIPLATVTLLAGIIYGLICYKATDNEVEKYSISPSKITRVCISRAVVVLVCNICLNSLILYSSYVNKDFSIFNPETYNAFFVWLTPRITKNCLQLVADIVLISVLVPLIMKAYTQVKNSYSSKKRRAS